MLTTLNSFVQDESGATAMEYGLLTALVAVGVSAFLSAFGCSIEEAFAKVSTQLLSSVPQAGVQIVPPDPA
jgi:pilus assembly protein Flp/PilA